MNVPFMDYSQQYQTIKHEIDTGFKQVFESGDFILGEQASEFEHQFADYCNAQYAVGVNSGTDALYLSLSAIGVGPGDEVIVPTHTFIATALCVSYTGATPVFVDIEEQSFNIDPQKFEERITSKTKAIIVVHLYGQSADMDAINAIAKKHNVIVIEDACQAHGATYRGKKTGSLGDIGCFSFYPTKSLGAFGDAGMIVASDFNIDEKIKLLRDYGRKGRYEHAVKGYNSRLDTLQAVVLLAKLKYLDDWNQMRAENAAYYRELLKDVPQVSSPMIKENRTHVFQSFAIRISNRDEVLKQLKVKDIETCIHYPVPIHLQDAYQELNYKKGDFPIAESVADNILSLPMYPHLTKDQIEYVCDSIKEFAMENV